MSREGIMLAKPFEDRLLQKMEPPYLIQRKINGERCLATISEFGVELRSSEGNIFGTVPHINQRLIDMNLPHGTYDGELYRHGWKLQQIHSVVSSVRKKLHIDYEQITYQIFDCTIEKLKQIDRIMYLNTMQDYFNLTPNIERVETFGVSDVNDIPELVKVFLDEGYEGAIIRNKSGFWEPKRTSNLLKIKPRATDEYRIVGALEEISIHGEPKNALGAFVCMKDDQHFKVGSGSLLTRVNRELLWREKDKLPGKVLTVKYQELTTRGVPYCPVAISVT